MAAYSDIPYLIDLIDDESPVVQDAISQAFKKMGPDLDQKLKPFSLELANSTQEKLHQLTQNIRMEKFEVHWLDWLEIEDEREALESAMGWLSYLSAPWGAPSLSTLLDNLQDRFFSKGNWTEVPLLLDFLFRREEFTSPQDTYYDPSNSNLIEVIQRRQGLQISLSLIAVMLARRLTLPLYGFNMPGHFMMVWRKENEYSLHDPFNQGKSLPRPTQLYLERILKNRGETIKIYHVETHQIVLRVLRNLINAHTRINDESMAAAYQTYHDKLVQLIKTREEIQEDSK